MVVDIRDIRNYTILKTSYVKGYSFYQYFRIRREES